MKEAKACENIHEIRECIDEIDEQILISFGKRMEYVKEIVKFKTDADGIVARDRQLQLLQKFLLFSKNYLLHLLTLFLFLRYYS
jgi:chorismate mutase